MSREITRRAVAAPTPTTAWRVSRDLARVEAATVGRVARVQGEAAVQHEKLVEVDRLARTAMSGQAMLSRWAATLSAGDAFVADELKFFSDVAKLGKGEIIADTIDEFGREGRR